MKKNNNKIVKKLKNVQIKFNSINYLAISHIQKYKKIKTSLRLIRGC